MYLYILGHDLWFQCSKGDSPQELDFALSAQSSDTDIWREGDISDNYVERLSCGLISLVNSSVLGRAGKREVRSAVQFIHHSVQEYLVNGQGIRDLGGSGSSIATRTMQLDIVRTCYQSIPPSRGSASRTRTLFHKYALEFMFIHARSAEEGQTAQHDLARILNWPREDFVKRLATFPCKHRTPEGYLEQVAREGTSLLHFAADQSTLGRSQNGCSSSR